MRYPLLIVLAAIVIVALGAVGLRRQLTRTPVRWVAHSQIVRDLPRYRVLVRRLKTTMYAYVAAVIVLASTVALLAGAPATTTVTDKKQINRDIILCLDTSGSMIFTDREVTDTFQEIIRSFHGERVGLHIWNYAGQTKFPLTDDYDMATTELQTMQHLMESATERGGHIYVSYELLDYLKPVEPPEGVIAASLVADGIAGCALAFPRVDDGRKRTMILATDNEPQGKSIYTLNQAIDLAKQRDITIFGLYAHTPGPPAPQDPYDYSGDSWQQQKKQLSDAVESTGGQLFDVSDPSSVDTILTSVTSEGDIVDDSGKVTTTTDNNDVYVLFLFIAASAVILIAGRRRL